jgi:hypothetical protein
MKKQLNCSQSDDESKKRSKTGMISLNEEKKKADIRNQKPSLVSE